MKWEQIPITINAFGSGGGNYILDCETFFISYNPSVQESGFDKFMPSSKLEETAICVRESSKFYILNGDHRKAYEILAPKGLSSCIEYYKNNAKEKSEWSVE